MKHSTDRILTSHVGSLVRPPDLVAMLAEKFNGKSYDEAAFQAHRNTPHMAETGKKIPDLVSKRELTMLNMVSNGKHKR